MMFKKGDVFFADLNPVVGSEQGGIRPVVVIQNNIGNRFSPTIIAAITSQTNKSKIPTHVEVRAAVGGLERSSVIMTEQAQDNRQIAPEALYRASGQQNYGSC